MDTADSSTEQKSDYTSQKSTFHNAATAEKIFTSTDVDFGFPLTNEFKANIRILGQIYETIQRYLTGLFRKSEAYYPSTKNTYSDLQLLKRTISDKVPMPYIGEFEKLTYILATQNPAFISIIRELHLDKSGNIIVVSRYVAPTEKHPDKVDVAYQATITKCVAVIKTYISQGEKIFDWENELLNTTSLEDLDLLKGRMDTHLKMMLIKGLTDQRTDQTSLSLIKKVNTTTHHRILVPLVQLLMRNKFIISFGCKDVRSSRIPGTERYPDILLINNTDYIQRRYDAACTILSAPYCVEHYNKNSQILFQEQLKNEEITQNEYYSRLSKDLFQRMIDGKSGLPEKLLDPVVEVMKMSSWKVSFEKVQKQLDEQNSIKDIGDNLLKHGGLFHAKHGSKLNIEEKFLKSIMVGKIPAILSCTDPHEDISSISGSIEFNHYDNIFVILKDRKITAKAIDKAIDLYEKNEDSYLIRILERILQYK